MACPPIWSIYPTIDSAERQMALAMRRPMRSLFANRTDMHDALEGMCDRPCDAIRAREEVRRLPVPRLRSRLAGFAPGLIHDGIFLISARLRDALATPEGEVHYGPVDTTGCGPVVRSAGYTTFQPLRVADPIDHGRSDGAWTDAGDGSNPVWEPLGGPNRPSPRIALRDDFLPPASVFLVPPGVPVVTDAAAERGQRAGVDDVMFARLGNERGQTDLVYRTL